MAVAEAQLVTGKNSLLSWIVLFVEQRRSHGVGAEHFELFPRDGDIADDPPPQAALRPWASDLDDFGAQRPSGAVWVTEQNAAVWFDANDFADHPPTRVVASEADRLVVTQPEAGEGGRRALHS